MSRSEGYSSSTARQVGRGSSRPLAPRDSQSSESGEAGPPSASSRPPRLSHRSRAGCWTCRGRKVKCDEQRPRCGPCTRLDRQCDWEYRWNFNDATSSTQSKYENINISGSTVWDPEARRSPRQCSKEKDAEDDAAFVASTNDDQRERLAEKGRPGSFGVVVTPESFADLPQYATAGMSSARRLSGNSTSSGGTQRTSSIDPSSSKMNPNFIFLIRFEDFASMPTTTPSPTGSSGALSSPLDGFPDVPPAESVDTMDIDSSDEDRGSESDERLVRHFTEVILPRISQPLPLLSEGIDAAKHMATTDFCIATSQFTPLHHAMCAMSALNLACTTGEATLEEALQHYHKALSPRSSANKPEDMLTHGIFFRHSMLLAYDTCVGTFGRDSGGVDMWATHLKYLGQIASLRYGRAETRETDACVVWWLCTVDMYSCLLGKGDCEFITMVQKRKMVLPLEKMVVFSDHPWTHKLFEDWPILYKILALNQAVVLWASRVARMARAFRAEESAVRASNGSVPEERITEWRTQAMQLEARIAGTWMEQCPDALRESSAQMRSKLPTQARYYFEHALGLHHAAILYARTSMFSGQRRYHIHEQDTKRRVCAIITLVNGTIDADRLEERHTIFPLFMAGVAATRPETKVAVLHRLQKFEPHGIGLNTKRTRELLAAVYEEQQNRANDGRMMEEVDWMTVAAARNFGLHNISM